NDLGGRSYLDSCTDWKIQEMINEILARNHYKFKTKEWFNYFSTFDWYFYNTSDMSVAESRFNNIERANYNFLAKYRNGN
ncbi:MAG: YARHG domain-containing protein, partial [Clostridia bacterium]|nr:YARHG domain-containing protein [Clostridia bacterium]